MKATNKDSGFVCRVGAHCLTVSWLTMTPRAANNSIGAGIPFQRGDLSALEVLPQLRPEDFDRPRRNLDRATVKLPTAIAALRDESVPADE